MGLWEMGSGRWIHGRGTAAKGGAVALALLLWLPQPWAGEITSHAPDWPQWRGPGRDGRAAGPAWPGDLKGLEPVWRVPLGRGYSGPIVTADRVFTVETVRVRSFVFPAISKYPLRGV